MKQAPATARPEEESGKLFVQIQ